MFNETLGIWPRAGITYVKASTESADDFESNSSATALTLEAPLVIAPRDNIAFTAGPTLDLGLSTSSESTSGDVTVEDDDDDPATEFGVQFGLTVFF